MVSNDADHREWHPLGHGARLTISVTLVTSAMGLLAGCGLYIGTSPSTAPTQPPSRHTASPSVKAPAQRAPHANGPSVTATQVTTYYPSDSKVTSGQSGSCFGASIASDRSDAFRCTAGNAILDPCFLDGSNAVFCPAGVPPASGVLVNLTAPLPANTNSDAPGAAPPWAMQLSNGATCLVVTGAGIANFPFSCNTGTADGPPLFCTAPSVPNAAGVVSTECGVANANAEVPTSHKVAVAHIWQ